jgi:hypothetical protein
MGENGYRSTKSPKRCVLGWKAWHLGSAATTMHDAQVLYKTIGLDTYAG